MAKVERKPLGRGSASHAGIHYYELYQCCERKFFIRAVLRISPKALSTPLIVGSAFHEGRDKFYKTKDPVAAAAWAKKVCASYKGLFESEETGKWAENRAYWLTRTWVEERGLKDLKQYNILASEKSLVTPVPGLPNFVFTGIPDTIVEDKKTKKVYALEAKHSSWSESALLTQLENGNQVSAYYWLIREELGVNIDGVLPDIAYWNKSSSDISKIRTSRPILIRRTPRDIEVLQKGVKQKFSEISQKVLAYRNGKDPDTLFSRNGFYCNAFNRECEFSAICRWNLTPKSKLPINFKREKGGVKPWDKVNDGLAQF